MSVRYLAPSVQKAFQILRLIAKSERGLKISDLARELEIGKSTVHGIAAALEEIGAVMRDPGSKRYRPGLTLLELGKSAYSRFDLKDIARPAMEELMENAQESVFLGVLNGDHITILDMVESRNDLKITSPVGTALPLLAGAAGKAFLAQLEPAHLARIMRARAIPRYTENTIADTRRYLAEIERVRDCGYAADDEEYIPGVRALAAPIRSDRHSASAIWVVGFKTTLDDEKMKTLAQATRAAAESISRRIEKQLLA